MKITIIADSKNHTTWRSQFFRTPMIYRIMNAGSLVNFYGYTPYFFHPALLVSDVRNLPALNCSCQRSKIRGPPIWLNSLIKQQGPTTIACPRALRVFTISWILIATWYSLLLPTVMNHGLRLTLLTVGNLNVDPETLPWIMSTASQMVCEWMEDWEKEWEKRTSSRIH